MSTKHKITGAASDKSKGMTLDERSHSSSKTLR
jgi:hypothetical protein